MLPLPLAIPGVFDFLDYELAFAFSSGQLRRKTDAGRNA